MASTELSVIQKEILAAKQQQTSQVEALSGNKIKVSRQGFTFPDGQTAASEMVCVIVEFGSQNRYYDTPYNENNPTPPACWAANKAVKELAPDDSVEDPQSTSCSTCPMNEFGSNGKGKACSNRRFLAVLPPDADEGDDLMLLDISPMSLKNFDAYIHKLDSKYGKIPVEVETTVRISPNSPTNYAILEFDTDKEVDNIATFWARRGEADKIVLAAPPQPADDQPAPATRKTARKKRPARKAA